MAAAGFGKSSVMLAQGTCGMEVVERGRRLADVESDSAILLPTFHPGMESVHPLAGRLADG